MTGEQAELELIEKLRRVGLDVTPPGNFVAGKRIVSASGTWLDWSKAFAAIFGEEWQGWKAVVAQYEARGIKPHQVEAVQPQIHDILEQDRRRIQRELDASVPPRRRT